MAFGVVCEREVYSTSLESGILTYSGEGWVAWVRDFPGNVRAAHETALC